MRTMPAMVATVVLSGCGTPALMVHPDDSVLAKAGKFTARVLLIVPTLGATEFDYSCAREQGGTDEALRSCRDARTKGAVDAARQSIAAHNAAPDR
jgi:hypothetical protein